jgi:hypothetical protein
LFGAFFIGENLMSPCLCVADSASAHRTFFFAAVLSACYPCASDSVSAHFILFVSHHCGAQFYQVAPEYPRSNVRSVHIRLKSLFLGDHFFPSRFFLGHLEAQISQRYAGRGGEVIHLLRPSKRLQDSSPKAHWHFFMSQHIVTVGLHPINPTHIGLITSAYLTIITRSTPSPIVYPSLRFSQCFVFSFQMPMCCPH